MSKRRKITFTTPALRIKKPQAQQVLTRQYEIHNVNVEMLNEIKDDNAGRVMEYEPQKTMVNIRQHQQSRNQKRHHGIVRINNYCSTKAFSVDMTLLNQLSDSHDAFSCTTNESSTCHVQQSSKVVSSLYYRAIQKVLYRSRIGTSYRGGEPSLDITSARSRVPTKQEIATRSEWKEGCPYCGHKLDHRPRSFYKASLDRIDTTFNYYKHPKTGACNYVLCCRACNMMRNDENILDFLRILLRFSESKSNYIPTQHDIDTAAKQLDTYITELQHQNKTCSGERKKPCKFQIMMHNLKNNSLKKWHRTPPEQRIADAKLLRDKYIQQGGMQYGTNLRMRLDTQTDIRDLLMVSADHVDPNGNSAISNIHLVCYGYNTMKNNFSKADADAHLDWLRQNYTHIQKAITSTQSSNNTYSILGV